jgi:hypothetical protein
MNDELFKNIKCEELKELLTRMIYDFENNVNPDYSNFIKEKITNTHTPFRFIYKEYDLHLKSPFLKFAVNFKKIYKPTIKMRDAIVLSDFRQNGYFKYKITNESSILKGFEIKLEHKELFIHLQPNESECLKKCLIL